MKWISFSKRNIKEMLRDPLTLFFGLGFPIILLLLLSLINKNVPAGSGPDLFQIENLSPGVAMFGLSFVALFSGMIIAKDRSSSFMLRLFTSPMKAWEFLLGYTLPLIPMSLLQMTISFLTALLLGLTFTWRIFLCLVVLLPAALVFIAIGLLCGTILTDKQVGGICGALMTNLSAWLSGIWFDPAMVGGAFERVAKALPFLHAVNAGRYALSGSYDKIMPQLWWVIGYAVGLTVIAVLVFTQKMHGDHH